MTFAQTILPEFQHEMATTRKLLERVPEDKLDWKANAKSNTVGWNACHLAEIPSWGASIVGETIFDMRAPFRMPASQRSSEDERRKESGRSRVLPRQDRSTQRREAAADRRQRAF